MRAERLLLLRCPECGSRLRLEAGREEDGAVLEGILRCACARVFPVSGGVPRLVPERPPDAVSHRTQALFGDEWQRFPELLRAHEQIFAWYFEGGEAVAWPGLDVLDAGCGMGRWLHFARRRGGGSSAST